MTLPTFLGIGAPRCGTTWLHHLLSDHPDVYVPVRRKEVEFFNEYYDRGLQWYEQFFPSETEAVRYQAIGEISPRYLYHASCPERIASVPSITRLILMVRNPVERAYSNYGFFVQHMNFRGSFEDFLSREPWAVQLGFYSLRLKDYLRYFSRDQVLVLLFEQAVTDVSGTKDALACFLEIASERFSAMVGATRVNASFVPKARLASALYTKAFYKLRQWNLDWISKLMRKLGVERLLSQGGQLPPMREETWLHLAEIYAGEIEEFESLLQVDLACWKLNPKARL